MRKQIWVGVIMAGLLTMPIPVAAEEKALPDNRFEEKMRALGGASDQAERSRRAHSFLTAHWFSSLQVKAIAARLGDDNARLEFAIAAYPRTVDPENFYEVYDAFKALSKVMRLHDRIRPVGHRGPGPVVQAPQPVSADEMRDILKSLRKESFDQTRAQIARQILSSSRSRFLSSQVKQIVECFDFEPSRLEIAKYAYDYTFDKERYFLVNDAFSFENTRANLSKYIQSQPKTKPLAETP